MCTWCRKIYLKIINYILIRGIFGSVAWWIQGWHTCTVLHPFVRPNKYTAGSVSTGPRRTGTGQTLCNIPKPVIVAFVAGPEGLHSLVQIRALVSQNSGDIIPRSRAIAASIGCTRTWAKGKKRESLVCGSRTFKRWAKGCYQLLGHKPWIVNSLGGPYASTHCCTKTTKPYLGEQQVFSGSRQWHDTTESGHNSVSRGHKL